MWARHEWWCCWPGAVPESPILMQLLKAWPCPRKQSPQHHQSITPAQSTAAGQHSRPLPGGNGPNSSKSRRTFFCFSERATKSITVSTTLLPVIVQKYQDPALLSGPERHSFRCSGLPEAPSTSLSSTWPNWDLWLTGLAQKKNGPKEFFKYFLDQQIWQLFSKLSSAWNLS